MADDRNEEEPTQQTPTGHEIPIPKRSTWDKLLDRVARGGAANGADHKKGKRSAD